MDNSAASRVFNDVLDDEQSTSVAVPVTFDVLTAENTGSRDKNLELRVKTALQPDSDDSIADSAFDSNSLQSLFSAAVNATHDAIDFDQVDFGQLALASTIASEQLPAANSWGDHGGVASFDFSGSNNEGVVRHCTCEGCLNTGQNYAGNSSDSAPPTTNGTLQQLANYIRVGYWADIGGRSPRSWGVGATVTFNIQDLNSDERALARAAFGLWDDIANINFSEVTVGGQIVMNNNGSGSAGASSTPYAGGTLTAVSIGISTDWWPNANFYSYMFQTYIHEIGHSLGLGHLGPYNGSATLAQRNWFNDSWQQSVMSYIDQTDGGTGSYRFVTGPQFADIRAMQDIYGVRFARTGDNVYGYNGTSGIAYSFTAMSAVSAFTIYDSGGTDTLDGSGSNATQVFDLRSGNMSSVGGFTNNIGIWVGTTVENAIGGGGADTFFGNTADNVFTGNGGTDLVRFAGSRSQFSFTETNSYTVTGASQGIDTLNGIERFQFDDITVTDDIIGGTNTARSITMGGTNTGEVQFTGDRDWFRVTLAANTRYVIDLRGFQSGVGTLSDTLLGLYGSGGAAFVTNDDSGFGLESLLAFRVDVAGTYYVGASGFSTGLGTFAIDMDNLGTGTNRFQNAESALTGSFTVAEGWTSNNIYLRQLADVNGDGRADIIGFAQPGVFVSLATANGFAAPVASIVSFTPGAGGWANNDYYTRAVGDINGDGRADIVGFGSVGVFYSLGSGGTGFASAVGDIASYGPSNAAGGWTSDNIFHRTLADVNGDGRADIVAFGGAGVYISLAKTASVGFNAAILGTNTFGTSVNAGSWSNYQTYPRAVADVNGDGRADIIGFGGNGAYVSLGNGNGTFQNAILGINSFGAGFAGGGWGTFDQYPRLVRDLNNDGRADIVGFGSTNVYVAFGQANGTFSAVSVDIAAFGAAASAGGWTSNDVLTRLLGDVTGDGRPDIVAFGGNNVYISRDFDFVTV